jgi:hypothetical protein
VDVGGNLAIDARRDIAVVSRENLVTNQANQRFVSTRGQSSGAEISTRRLANQSADNGVYRYFCGEVSSKKCITYLVINGSAQAICRHPDCGLHDVIFKFPTVSHCIQSRAYGELSA